MSVPDVDVHRAHLLRDLEEQVGADMLRSEPGRALVEVLGAALERLEQERDALRLPLVQAQRELAEITRLHDEELVELGRIENALRERAMQFRALAENMSAAILIYQGTRLRYANHAASLLTGYSTEELLRLEVADLVHPEQRAMVRERGAARQRGEPVAPRYEFRIVTKAGEERWLDYTAGSIVYEGAPAILGTAFDITAYKRAQEALERQALVFANLYDAVMVSGPDGRIVEWNAAAERMYGYARPEALGATPRLWLPADASEAVERAIAEGLTRDGRWSGEIRFVRKDGSEGVSETVVVPLLDAGGRQVGALGVNRDITRRTEIEGALRASEQRYRALFEDSRDAIYMTTLDGQLVDVNQAFLDLFGHAREEIIGRNVRSLYLHPADRDRLLGEIARAGHVREYDVRFVRRGGDALDCLLTTSLRRGPDGTVVGYQGIIHDITERKRAEEQLAYSALHDTLTGLPNRALFLDRLRHAVERSRRGSAGLFAVLFLDVDRFKVINDSLGHGVGDQFLRALAHRLASVVRAGDTVARFGGDEFTMLLEELDDAQEASRVAERLLAAVGEPFGLERHEVFTSASVGVALSSTDFTEPEELLRNADAALGRAKLAGKARFEVFDHAMHASAVARLQTELDLRRAVERGEFTLHYQPIVDLRSGGVVGLEALARWRHPQRGLLLPADFIYIAEETGLIFGFGRWVLEEACRQLAQWHARRGPERMPRLAVNVSTRQFLQPDLVSVLERLMREHAIPPGALALEVTESVIVDNPDEVSALFARVRALGVEIHLDDFGTGYSSLGYLHRFPIDALKIDRSFVSRMERDARSTQLVEAMVRLAHSLGVRVIAEGVRAEAQLATLREMECDQAQGYHFSPPVAADEVEGLLETGRRW